MLKSRYESFEVLTGILPTSYNRAAPEFHKLKNSLQPHAALCLGQSVGRPCLNIEQFAANFAHSPHSDNDGLVLSNTTLEPDGQTAYRTILAADRLVNSAKNAGVPATVSISAGSFVCNALYYRALKESAISNFPICFVHLPALPESVLDNPQAPSMSKELSMRGIEAICEEIAIQIEN